MSQEHQPCERSNRFLPSPIRVAVDFQRYYDMWILIFSPQTLHQLWKAFSGWAFITGSRISWTLGGVLQILKPQGPMKAWEPQLIFWEFIWYLNEKLKGSSSINESKQAQILNNPMGSKAIGFYTTWLYCLAITYSRPICSAKVTASLD